MALLCDFMRLINQLFEIAFFNYSYCVAFGYKIFSLQVL